MNKEFRRILLAELPSYQVLGWQPAVNLPSGGVIVDCFSGGTGQSVLVSRELELEQLTDDEPRQLTMADQHLVEDLIETLRLEGAHHFELHMAVLQALVEASERCGARGAAFRFTMRKLDLARAHATGQGA